MKSSVYLPTIFILILASFLLLISNDITEFFIVMIISVLAYHTLYKNIIRSVKFNSKLIKIYSFSYVISFLFIIWINIVSIQLGGSEKPFMPGDSLGYFVLGKEVVKNGIEQNLNAINYIGYPLILSWIFKFFGFHLIMGLLTNMILLFVNIFLISKCVLKITKRPSDFQNTFLILLLTSTFMSTGFILLKDIFIITSITLSLYASLNLLNRQNVIKNYSLIIVSVIIMSLFRFSFIWAPILILITITIKEIKIIKLFPIIAVLIIGGLKIQSNYGTDIKSIEETIEFATSNNVITRKLDAGSSSTVSNFLFGYDNWSVLKKISFLPITSAFQYIIPFNVYSFDQSLIYPYYFISINYNIIWLFFTGPLLIFSIFNIKRIRKGNSSLVLKITYLGILFYLIPAFIFGGLIPRYSVPFYSLLLPIMAINLTEIKVSITYKKKWNRSYLLYFLTSLFLVSFYLIF